MKKATLSYETIVIPYKNALNYLEWKLNFSSLKEVSEEIELSINTIQKMRNNEGVTGKSWSKVRIWYCGQVGPEEAQRSNYEIIKYNEWI